MVVRELATSNDIVYLTGRPQRYRAATLAWLDKHSLRGAQLWMRDQADTRPASVIKVEVLTQLARDGDISIFIDDDDTVVQAATRAGFPCLRADWLTTSASHETL